MAFVEQFIYLIPRHFPVSLQTLYGMCGRLYVRLCAKLNVKPYGRLSGAMLLSVGGLFAENKRSSDNKLFPDNRMKNNPLLDWKNIRPVAGKVHRTFCEPAFGRRIEADNNKRYHQKRWRTERISGCRSHANPLLQVLMEPAGPVAGVGPGYAGIPLS